MTDFLLLEQMHKMVKETPKPRLMYRKGISAEGFFRPYMSMSEYTRASIFSSLDEITPVSVRFSSMLGDKGTADTVRNIKAMDVKFKAAEGSYDMLCRSLPVLFINDEKKLLQLFRALSRRERLDGICSRRFWSFVTENPEAVNCALRLFSQQGLSDSFVYMNWYSVNDSIWSNAKEEQFHVRFRWTPVKDVEETERFGHINRNSAEFMAGYEPDRAVNDLKRRIARGKFPAYELQVQVKYGDGEQNRKTGDSDMHKRTLLWDERECPYLSVGIMKLTGMPEDYRMGCDLLSFAPGNTIDGIDIYRDDFVDIMDYIYKIEAAERGAVL